MPLFRFQDYLQDPNYLSYFLTDPESYRLQCITTMIKQGIFTEQLFIDIAKTFYCAQRGKTVLHAVTEAGDLELAGLLVAIPEINPFLPDKNNHTALTTLANSQGENLPLINIFLQNHCCIDTKLSLGNLNVAGFLVLGKNHTVLQETKHIFDKPSLVAALTQPIPIDDSSLKRLRYRLHQYLLFLSSQESKSTQPQWQKLESIRQNINELLETNILKKIAMDLDYIPTCPLEQFENPLISMTIMEKSEALEINNLQEVSVALIEIPMRLTEAQQIALLQVLYSTIKQQAPYVSQEHYIARLEQETERLNTITQIKDNYLKNYLDSLPTCGNFIETINLNQICNILLSCLLVALTVLTIGLAAVGFIMFYKYPDVVSDESFEYNDGFIYFMMAMVPGLLTAGLISCYRRSKNCPNETLLGEEERVALNDCLQNYLTTEYGFNFSDADNSSQIGVNAIMKWKQQQETNVIEKKRATQTLLTQSQFTLFHRAPPRLNELVALEPTFKKSAKN